MADCDGLPLLVAAGAACGTFALVVRTRVRRGRWLSWREVVAWAAFAAVGTLVLLALRGCPPTGG